MLLLLLRYIIYITGLSLWIIYALIIKNGPIAVMNSVLTSSKGHREEVTVHSPPLTEYSAFWIMLPASVAFQVTTSLAPAGDALHVGEEFEVLHDGEVLVQRESLCHVAGALLHPERLSHRIVAQDAGGPGSGQHQPGEEDVAELCEEPEEIVEAHWCCLSLPCGTAVDTTGGRATRRMAGRICSWMRCSNRPSR